MILCNMYALIKTDSFSSKLKIKYVFFFLKSRKNCDILQQLILIKMAIKYISPKIKEGFKS